LTEISGGFSQYLQASQTRTAVFSTVLPFGTQQLRKQRADWSAGFLLFFPRSAAATSPTSVCFVQPKQAIAG